MSHFTDTLNPAQKEAVLNYDKPSLIVAGAGSGKTRVLTSRIAYMIEQGVHPGSILALTFTNKAAGELRERLSAMLGATAEDVGAVEAGSGVYLKALTVQGNTMTVTKGDGSTETVMLAQEYVLPAARYGRPAGRRESGRSAGHRPGRHPQRQNAQ